MSYPLFYFLIVCKHTFSSFLLCSRRGIQACFSLLCPARPYFSRFFSSFLLPAGHPSLFFSPMPRLDSLFLPFLFFPAPGGASLPLFLFHAPPRLTFPAFSLLPCSRRGIQACFSLPCPARPYFSRFFSSFLLPAGHLSLFFSPMPRLVSLFPFFLFFPASGGASKPVSLSYAPPGL